MRPERSKLFRLVLAVLLAIGPAGAENPPVAPNSRSEVMNDLIETGLTALYNLDYENAYRSFENLSENFPDHPMGPYARTTALWWELVNEHDENNEKVERSFLDAVERTMTIAEKMIKRGDPLGEARLCLGGALGFKSRWEAMQGHWIRAYTNGKAAYTAQKEALEVNPELYDAYLGVGIFHYFTATLPGVVRILARLVRMKGDKERGLNEIRLAMEKGRFARTAARLFLIGILNNNEKDYDEALKLVREGRVRYPDSSFFHLLEMITLENAGRWRELRVLSEDYLRRIRGREPSYPSHYVHRGYFFLGNSHLGEGHAALAAELYTESLNDFSSSDRWTTWTYLNRGRAYDRLDERKKALADYETVLKRRDVWGLHDLARRFMRNPDEGEFQRKG